MRKRGGGKKHVEGMEKEGVEGSEIERRRRKINGRDERERKGEKTRGRK
jgi:hypothetical protein